MYRFDSIEDFEKSFDAAYSKAIEEEFSFNDFDAVALLLIRQLIAFEEGRFDGLMESATAFGGDSDLFAREADEIKSLLEIYIETCTKKMEELGLF